MKNWLVGVAIFSSIAAAAQQGHSFSSIDWQMQTTEALTPDSLGALINARFTTQLEKVRAVYSWITSHISYNTAIYNPRPAAYRYDPDPLDTAAVWPSGDERVARRVMRRKIAVCDGYAKLFKVICGYAGIEAEIIQGFGKGVGSNKFRTNHSWNAVKIDSIWHLLDVTWASGFVTYTSDYVQKQNDFYFLTPPEQFIYDHHPEELRWTLLLGPPVLSEFKKALFRSKHFSKYEVTNFWPQGGVIEAAIGDTLQFSVQLKDVVKARQTCSDPFMDTTTYSLWPSSVFLQPQEENGNFISFSYVVRSPAQWIHLTFKDDVLMRYHLEVTDDKFVSTAR